MTSTSDSSPRFTEGDEAAAPTPTRPGYDPPEHPTRPPEGADLAAGAKAGEGGKPTMRGASGPGCSASRGVAASLIERYESWRYRRTYGRNADHSRAIEAARKARHDR